jgi:hypothetical protein
MPTTKNSPPKAHCGQSTLREIFRRPEWYQKKEKKK